MPGLTEVSTANPACPDPPSPVHHQESARSARVAKATDGGMDPEAAGVVAGARGRGNRAAQAQSEQVLRDDDRRLAAERELQNMSGALMFSAAILTAVLARSSAHPPAWVPRARETGEQRLRARLCELLGRSGIGVAAALVGVLCAHQARLRAAAPAERALAAARALFGAFLALFLAFAAVAGTESWGETAAALCFEFATAAVTWLYLLEELKGVVVRVGRALGWCFSS